MPEFCGNLDQSNVFRLRNFERHGHWGLAELLSIRAELFECHISPDPIRKAAVMRFWSRIRGRIYRGENFDLRESFRPVQTVVILTRH
jgi:hypothetical protein